MELCICKTAEELGLMAAERIARELQQAIDQNHFANLLVSTGASQFDTLNALVKQDVDFSRVTMYHLDEYVGISDTHPASFCRYLIERFVSKVKLKEAVLIHGEKDVEERVLQLNQIFMNLEIDVGVIGIGENAHVAFNDPPADFELTDAFHIVDLDERCKQQQVGEGWFASIVEVPTQAISMTCSQIMKCKAILSPVPYPVKAKAIKKMLTANEITNLIPATILLNHPKFSLFLDDGSASMIPKEVLASIRNN